MLYKLLYFDYTDVDILCYLLERLEQDTYCV